MERHPKPRAGQETTEVVLSEEYQQFIVNQEEVLEEELKKVKEKYENGNYCSLLAVIYS